MPFNPNDPTFYMETGEEGPRYQEYPNDIQILDLAPHLVDGKYVLDPETGERIPKPHVGERLRDGSVEGGQEMIAGFRRNHCYEAGACQLLRHQIGMTRRDLPNQHRLSPTSNTNPPIRITTSAARLPLYHAKNKDFSVSCAKTPPCQSCHANFRAGDVEALRTVP